MLKHGRNARFVDFSHFHLEYPHPILLPIWLAAKVLLRFYWIKYILDGSLPRRYQDFTKPQRQRFTRAIRAVDEFIVVSETLAKWLRDEIKVTQKIAVIPCLLNLPEQDRERRISPDTATQLQTFLQRPRRVCSIGTFISNYGFSQVANAVEQLRGETGEEIGLLLLDGGFAIDETYRAQIVNNRPWITVIKDVPNPDVYQILRECDLFVRAVDAEGFGISRVEAIWNGVPVVATNVGETRGMLTYEFGDEKKLAELIESVLFKEPRTDLSSTAELFRNEANQNLQKFVETVGFPHKSGF